VDALVDFLAAVLATAFLALTGVFLAVVLVIEAALVTFGSGTVTTF